MCHFTCESRCACNRGYVRNGATGKCVKLVDCPGYQSEFSFIHQILFNHLSSTSQLARSHTKLISVVYQIVLLLVSGLNMANVGALTDVLKTLLAPATAKADITNLRPQANALRKESASSTTKRKEAESSETSF